MIEYRTSSSCTYGNCVAVGVGPDGRVAVRDTKDPGGPELLFTPEEWAAFTAGVRNGEFDFS